MRETVGWTAAVIVGLLIIVSLAIAAWQLHWFVAEKNVEKQVHIDNKNKGTQMAWHDEAVNAISEYNTAEPSNTAARSALRIQACNLIARLSPEYRDDQLVAFEGVECS